MSEPARIIEHMNEKLAGDELGARLADELIDERDVLDAELRDSHPRPADEHRAAMWSLEHAEHDMRVAAAEKWRVIAEVLRDARSDPDGWVGPDPTLDPLWTDPRDRTVAAVRRERRDIAVRAAAADIAARLQLSETMVRSRADHARTLRERCPQLWASFLGGRIPEANAIIVAQLAASLPDDPESWSLFDERALSPAARHAPGRFRTSARAIRERVHAESLDERHRRAAADRGVWLTPDLDGMATLTAVLPAVAAHALMANLDSAAHDLRGSGDEQRTLAQLRADVLAALVPSEAGGRRASVAIKIPVMSMLGESDEPATLDGYGPIDLETAKRLAGSATSWIRILTHPVSGTVLDVDRKTYRVPADLRRWLGVQHPLCISPGCGRLARDCDLDHRIEWQYGGRTASDNLAPLCEPHHVVRHGSKWKLDREEHGLVWTSPTGLRWDADPPPF